MREVSGKRKDAAKIAASPRTLAELSRQIAPPTPAYPMLSALTTLVQWMRWCDVCESEQIFTAGWECRGGLVGCCMGCGGESVAPFTRACLEAA